MTGDPTTNTTSYTIGHVGNAAIGDHAVFNEAAQAPDGGARRRSGIGVITVIPVETRSVRELLGLRPRPDGFAVGDGSPRVVSVQAHGQGQGSAMAAARRLDDAFAPRVLLLAGIAGGIRDLVLGDVLVATRVVCYDLHKQTDSGTRHRGRGWQAPIEVCRSVDGFFADRGEPAAFGGFVARGGLIGSGNAVVASEHADARRFLTSFSDKVLAVDMEADGLGQYCHEADGLGWAVVRGISDYADARKGDDRQAGAAWNAALVLCALIAHLPS
jgi:adenosylhomocysteine nucleosidase